MAFNPLLVVAKGARPEWYALTAPYARSQRGRSFWQLANSLIPYLLLLGLMCFTVRQDYPYVATLALAVIAAVFYVQHQFQGVYWARTEEWDPQRVAMEGASFYRLAGESGGDKP